MGSRGSGFGWAACEQGHKKSPWVSYSGSVPAGTDPLLVLVENGEKMDWEKITSATPWDFLATLQAAVGLPGVQQPEPRFPCEALPGPMQPESESPPELIPGPQG